MFSLTKKITKISLEGVKDMKNSIKNDIVSKKRNKNNKKFMGKKINKKNKANEKNNNKSNSIDDKIIIEFDSSDHDESNDDIYLDSNNSDNLNDNLNNSDNLNDDFNNSDDKSTVVINTSNSLDLIDNIDNSKNSQVDNDNDDNDNYDNDNNNIIIENDLIYNPSNSINFDNNDGLNYSNTDELIYEKNINDQNDTDENVIKETLNYTNNYHKNYLINKINNVYNVPLLPIIEETTNTDTLNNNSILKKGYWDRKLGRVYRIKFLCQICGKVPEGFKGYRIHLLKGWAKSALKTFSISLNVLEFALNVAGIHNGISEIGRALLKSFDTLRDELVRNKIDGVDMEKLNMKKIELDYLIAQKEEEYIAHGNAQYINTLDTFNASNDLVKFIPVNTDYINGIVELFESFGETIPPKKCGLVCVTRMQDFECAWVCAGLSDGTSSECYKKFMNSNKLNTMVRFQFK